MSEEEALLLDNISLHSDDPEQRTVAMAFHPDGAFTFNALGKYKKLSSSPNFLSQVVIPISDEELMLFHSAALYKVNVGTGKATKLSDDGWDLAKVVLRSKEDPDHLLVLHTMATYRVNINTGKYEKVQGSWLGLTDGWSFAKEVVYDPEQDRAFVFHTNGLYKVNPKDGSYESVPGNDFGWGEAHAAVYHRTGAIVFHTFGTYRLDMNTGKYENLGGSWASAQTAVLLDEDTALVLCSMGMYRVDLLTGNSTSEPGDLGWSQVKCATNLGANVMAAAHVEAKHRH